VGGDKGRNDPTLLKGVATMATATKFKLTSPSFASGGLMNARHTCDGQNLSPELQWTHVPEGTRSFALIVDDPDAPSGRFTHWLLFDFPASTHGLAEGTSGIGVPGQNDFQQVGYGGPCPPPKDGPHGYFFTLYALDVDSLELPQGATRHEIEGAMEHHILDHAELVGGYARARS
jgi:Raf kinase inhibitor-like YbhB/YbcL family protein